MLAPRVSAESEYQKIMGNVKIDDPLSLEERCLDFQYRNRKLESDLRMLKKQAGSKGKSGQNDDIKKLSKQILSAEQDDEETKQQRAKSEREMEEKLRAQMLDRQKIKSEFEEISKRKKDLQSANSQELDDLSYRVNLLDTEHNELCRHNISMS